MKRNSYSNWREDLREVMDTINPDTDEPERSVKDKKVKNKVVINPELKEAFEGIGATVLEVFELDEKIDLKKADMGDVVKDFYKSDAPQFKGKTKKERQKMAIAAKLTAERGGRKLGEEDEIEEAVYGGTPKKKEEPKDTRMTITSADKKGNTPAYKAYKAGDKRYKAGAGLDEKMNLATADMGDVIKDFQKSDAPQFKGKSKEERRQMAIAAKLTAERGGKKLGEQMDDSTEMSGTSTDDKRMDQQKKKIQMQKIRDLTVRLAAARKGVY